MVEEFWKHNQASLLHAAKLPRAPYLIPHGPDALDLRVQFLSAQQARLTAHIDDALSGYEPIVAAECYLGLPPWAENAVPIPMFPDDGNWDTSRESVSAELALEGLEPVKHILFVRGQDATGFWGPISAAWLDLSANQPPRVERVVPASEVQVPVFTPQQFTVVAHDPDGDPLRYSWQIDGRDLVSCGEPSVIYLPKESDIGNRTLEVTVSDGGRVVRHAWPIMVIPDHRTVVVDRSGTDTASYGSWVNSRAWHPWSWASAVARDSASTFRWLLRLPQAGTYDLYAWWTYGSSRSTAAPYLIEHAKGVDTGFADQSNPSLSGRWNFLGELTISCRATAAT